MTSSEELPVSDGSEDFLSLPFAGAQKMPHMTAVEKIDAIFKRLERTQREQMLRLQESQRAMESRMPTIIPFPAGNIAPALPDKDSNDDRSVPV